MICLLFLSLESFKVIRNPPQYQTNELHGAETILGSSQSLSNTPPPHQKPYFIHYLLTETNNNIKFLEKANYHKHWKTSDTS
jgi:hypothetical protein